MTALEEKKATARLWNGNVVEVHVSECPPAERSLCEWCGRRFGPRKRVRFKDQHVERICYTCAKNWVKIVTSDESGGST